MITTQAQLAHVAEQVERGLKSGRLIKFECLNCSSLEICASGSSMHGELLCGLCHWGKAGEHSDSPDRQVYRCTNCGKNFRYYTDHGLCNSCG